MNYTILTYLIYITASIGLTVWVATVLFKNGKVFLIDIFRGNQLLADSVNKLLLVGFYLINLGYATLTLKETANVLNAEGLIEVLSYKLGVIILILGAMHFFNIFVLFRLRKRAKADEQIKALYNRPPE